MAKPYIPGLYEKQVNDYLKLLETTGIINVRPPARLERINVNYKMVPQAGSTYIISKTVKVSSVRDGVAYFPGTYSTLIVDDFNWKLTDPKDWTDSNGPLPGDIWESNGSEYMAIDTDNGMQLRPTSQYMELVTEAGFERFLKTNPKLIRRK